jgi:polyhydroxybutyrate depolymerase
MKNTFLYASLLLIFSLFFGCNSSQTTSSIPEDSALIPGELSTQSILHNGKQREYLIYVPASYDENTNYPLLLNFHGFGWNTRDYMKYESDFRYVADQESVILVYPQALLLDGFSVWNAAPFAEDNKTSSDDIGFFKTLLNDLHETLSIDQNRIYVAGFSNGAMFVYALACFTENLIAGVAAVSGVQLNLEDCAPSRPIQVLIAHGTNDDEIFYNGSSDYTSVDETVLFWTSINQTATVAEVSNHNLGDETVWIYNYKEGTNGTQVLHYKVENGEHEWFAHNLSGQSFTSLVWDFLSTQTLSGSNKD